ncbi:MAG: pilus assembly protein PilP [Thermodesulfobacteriota bacterium]|nr:pilus assembly protein PilP [Thermodesulfobacteriota bacterium]
MKGLGAVFFLGITLILGGCGGDPPKTTKGPVPPAAKPKVAPAKAAALPAPVVKVEPPPVVIYTYNPKGKPDPFKPLIVERPETPLTLKKVAEAAPEPGTPLERLELSQIKLVALIWGIREPRAMVEDNAGKGYIITNGTPIGKNKGKVTQIIPTGVVVSERYETAAGKFTTREVTLKLYAD